MTVQKPRGGPCQTQHQKAGHGDTPAEAAAGTEAVADSAITLRRTRCRSQWRSILNSSSPENADGATLRRHNTPRQQMVQFSRVGGDSSIMLTHRPPTPPLIDNTLQKAQTGFRSFGFSQAAPVWCEQRSQVGTVTEDRCDLNNNAIVHEQQTSCP